MKNLIFLIILFLIISCNDSKVTTEFSESEVESTQLNSDAGSTNIESLGITVPDNIDDNFETFFKYFNEDSTFQISRIVFPLNVQVADPAKDYEFSEVIIQKEDFRKMDLTYDSLATTREFDKYEQKFKIKGNKAVIEIIGIDNGIREDYFFEKKNGKWVMVNWEDSST